jgi:uncharacterized protein
MARPLPRGVPGVAGMPHDVVLQPGETLAEGQRLPDNGLPFLWKRAAPDERDLWQPPSRSGARRRSTKLSFFAARVFA